MPTADDVQGGSPDRRVARQRWILCEIGVSLVVLLISCMALLGLPLGTVTDWIESLGTAGALAATAAVLRVEQRNRFADERQRQAKAVGGYLHWESQHGVDVLTATVHNASELPLRAVYVIAYDRDRSSGLPLRFPEIPVIRPGSSRDVSIDNPGMSRAYMVLCFDDDLGVTWRKYGSRPLEEISKSSPLPPWGDYMK